MTNPARREAPSDPLLGRCVEIRSAGGLVYRGTVTEITRADEFGELFRLGSRYDSEYVRLVYVTDRDAQIREIDGRR